MKMVLFYCPPGLEEHGKGWLFQTKISYPCTK